jgi:hypothetical protein
MVPPRFAAYDSGKMSRAKATLSCIFQVKSSLTQLLPDLPGQARFTRTIYTQSGTQRPSDRVTCCIANLLLLPKIFFR